MKTLRSPILLAALAAIGLALPVTGAAGALVVRDNDQDVSGGVLRPGGAKGCCGPGPCHGNFRLDNTGTVSIDAISFSVSDLSGPGATIPSSEMSFAPAQLPRLGPQGTRVITFKLNVAASLPSGSYRGVVTIAGGSAAGGDERLELPVDVVICGGSSEARLALVPGLGDYDGVTLTLRPGDAGCAGTAFLGEITVENQGGSAATAVAAILSGMPVGSRIVISPPGAVLAAGARQGFRIELAIPSGLGAGSYAGVFAASDSASGAAAQTAATFKRCDLPATALRIVAVPGGLRFTAGPQGCSGLSFGLQVAIESLAERRLEAVRLGLTGLPAGVQARMDPAQASLEPGGRAMFQVRLLVPPSVAAGSYTGTLSAEDSASGAKDAAPATLTRCDAGSSGLRLVAADGGSEIRFTPEPGGAGCAGNLFRAAFVIESTGTVALPLVRLAGEDFPRGSTVAFEPATLRLEAGDRVVASATLVTPMTLVPGSFGGAIVATPGLAPGGARAPASFTRCPPGLSSEIAVLLPEGEQAIPLVAGASGCAGDAFGAEVVVENRGDTDLARIELSFSGAPRAFVFAREPASLALARGARGSFRVTLGGVSHVAPGAYLASLMARDAASGAAAAALLRVERCAGPVINPDLERPRGPGDPTVDGPVLLALSHESSKSAVRSGEVLTLAVTVRNEGKVPVRDLVVEDRLPAGFVNVPGRAALDGRAIEDPDGASTLRFALGALAPGDEARLAFQVVVTSAAALGQAEAEATAHAGALAAGPVKVLIEVTRNSLRPFGEVRGLVRFEGGPGAPDVRLLLDSDRELRTDSEGRFLFAGVLGGEHLVSLDARSLAPGDRLIGEDSRLLRLFDGATGEVEFLLLARPRPSLALYRMAGAAEE